MAFALRRTAAPALRFSGLRIIAQMAATRRQRAALQNLTDRQLADLGITRSQAWEEAKRPFWEVPNTHRR